MLLEKVGKICFGQMRLPLFFAFLLLPLFFAGLYLFLENLEFKDLQQRFQIALEKGKIAIERKSAKERFLTRYGHSAPYFLDQQIESLCFLQKEQKELKACIEHPAMTQRDSFKERLFFLTSSENKLFFTEQNIRSSLEVKETDEKQRHVVQVDEEDLKKLLSLIEDIPIDGCNPAPHSPQLLIHNFQLRRHNTSIDTEVFLMEMSLLKREFNL